jgi:hypothetical protein
MQTAPAQKRRTKKTLDRYSLTRTTESYRRAAQSARRSAAFWGALTIGALAIPAVLASWFEFPTQQPRGQADVAAILMSLAPTLAPMSASSLLALFSARRCMEDRKLAATHEQKQLICGALIELAQISGYRGKSNCELNLVSTIVPALTASGAGCFASPDRSDFLTGVLGQRVSELLGRSRS